MKCLKAVEQLTKILITMSSQLATNNTNTHTHRGKNVNKKKLSCRNGQLFHGKENLPSHISCFHDFPTHPGVFTFFYLPTILINKGEKNIISDANLQHDIPHSGVTDAKSSPK